jgi:hypothetical protein
VKHAPSITTWSRLEGRSRRDDMQPGLRAAVYDPLWLLCRQWQLGAFRAEDSATPVGVQLTTETTAISRFAPGVDAAAAGKDYDGSLPLETLVEREQPRREPGTNLRIAAASGLRFLAFLEEHGADALGPDYTGVYRIDPPGQPLPDGETRRFLLLTTGRVPDGNKLYAAFHPAGTPAGAVTVPDDPDATGHPGVAQAALEWSQWYETVVDAPTTGEETWQANRLEHAFALAAPESDGETVLVAREYAGDRLDWHSFDVAPGASIGATGGSSPVSDTRTVLASPIAYGGMPARRWFEFEDATVNLGKVSAGPPDLAQMLLIEFASLYSNDHFGISIELPVGSLCRVTSLIVADNFGGRTRVRPSDESAGAPSWQMYRPSIEGSIEAAPVLFLTPTLANVLEGEPIEEVLFLRDEMANMAWAVERVIEGPTGGPLSRHEAYQEQRRRAGDEASPSEATQALRYRGFTGVPPNWIPLIPVAVSPGSHEVRLQLREMLDPDSELPIPPEGVLLDTSVGRLELYDEEVPRAGVRVRRSYRFTRWTDGSPHLWIGRTKGVGRGEGSSGLRFDTLETAPPAQG